MTSTATIDVPGQDARHVAPSRAVSLRTDAARADAEIAHRIKQTLAGTSSIDSTGIEVLVDHGVVTLHGHVRCWTEWHTVERVAWCPRGVHGVHNRLVIAYQGTAS